MAGNGQVRVTAEALAKAITDYEARKGEFEEQYQAIKSIVDELFNNYKSEAATAFHDKFETIYSNMSQTSAQMDNAIGKLKKVSDIFQAFVTIQQGLVSGLVTEAQVTGNIFG